MSTDETRTIYDRVTTAVADLGHPLYDDEHRRDVWNEASAVGFQALCWGLLVAATASVWIGGPAAVPYVTTMTLVLGASSVLVMVHAQRHGVDPWRSPGASPLRWGLAVGLGVLLVLGLVRGSAVASDLGPDLLATLAGGVVGGGGALLLTALAVRSARRRAPQGEDD